MSVWLLCALLFSPIGRTEQDGQPVSIKEVKLYAEETYCDTPDCGAWVLNVKWRDEFAGNDKSENASYDIEVLRTEQMTTVHLETIDVMPNKTAYYHWKWTSPIPLQCTSHSVRLRRHAQHHPGEWTQLYTYKGKDLDAERILVYPRDKAFMVGSKITFCCIVARDEVPVSRFLIRISNRTYISNPVPLDHSDQGPTSHVICEVKGNNGGALIFIGYPPDDHNLTCVTRDLSSVECHWKVGRDTHLTIKRKTNYTLNGRNCEFGKCTLYPLTKQVTKWTLIAKNPLGEKTLIDTDDPTRRVWLRAPNKISCIANARNVTLQWNWNENNYASFLMTCQVKLNGNIYNKTFNGVGLSSAVLENLKPFANYTAQVTCGSLKYLYKWGDWSEIIKFSTKEDIPEAVDVWIQYSEQNASVLWKPLTQEQSHGIVTGYEITIENTKGGSTKRSIGLNNAQLCYNIAFGSEKRDGIITVSAKNSAGLSPPSTIIIPSNFDNEVSISRVNSNNGGFEISWEESPSSTCGYVVEWFPTYSKTQCAVEWKKIPECDSDACYTSIQSDHFEAGVKYTISVYACTDDGPKLLKRSEGYATELKPGKVEELTSKLIGKSLELSWKEVPLDQQKGFIQHYKVKILHSEEINKTETRTVLESKVNLELDPGSYTIHVSAVTSGGEGDYATVGVNTGQINQMIVATVVGCGAATIVIFVITALCYKKRKWLKELLYPDIPEPKLAGKWLTKGISCTQMTEKYMKCEIQEILNVDLPAMSESLHRLDLISSNFKLIPAEQSYQTVSESPADVSYCPVEKLTTIIENPSYNLTMHGGAQMSDPTLEMQDGYLPAPNFVQNNFAVKDSEGYKPQSACHTNVYLQ